MMRNKKLLAALVLSGVLSISGAAFASAKEVKSSSLVGDIMRVVINHDRHTYRAQTLPEPPDFKKFDKNHKPPEFREGKRPPMSHDKRPDGKRLPPPPNGDKRPPKPEELKSFKPHMPLHHRHMAKR